MPVKFSRNNRVLAHNARAVDVAKSAIDKILDVQAARYNAAFKVEGFKAILYVPLQSGTPCACRGRGHTVQRLLDEDGKASKGLINNLVTGEAFEVAPYGVVPQDVSGRIPEGVSRAAYEENPEAYVVDFELDGVYARTNMERSGFDDVFGVKDGSKGRASTADDLDPPTSAADGFSTTMDDPRARTIVPFEFDSLNPGTAQGDAGFNVGGPASEFEQLLGDYDNPNAEAELTEKQRSLVTNEATEKAIADGLRLEGGLDVLGYSDIACPVCFGTGYVGGYRIHNGFRHVESIATGPKYLGDAAVIDMVPEIPVVRNCEGLVFSVQLPSLAVHVDSLKVFAGKSILPALFFVDGAPITQEHSLLRFCDGRYHEVRIELKKPAQFTHVEMQLNQSREWTLFEFPRVNKSGDQDKTDDTDNVTINASPIIPYIGPKCIIVESTYAKAWLVKATNTWNDRRRRVLGWDCDARVLQPTELQNLLPKRTSLESPKRMIPVRDNRYGHHRT